MKHLSSRFPCTLEPREAAIAQHDQIVVPLLANFKSSEAGAVPGSSVFARSPKGSICRASCMACLPPSSIIRSVISLKLIACVSLSSGIGTTFTTSIAVQC